MMSANVITTCKYEEHNPDIPGTIPTRRQSIIQGYEELSPMAHLSSPSPSQSPGLHFLTLWLCMEHGGVISGAGPAGRDPPLQ